MIWEWYLKLNCRILDSTNRFWFGSKLHLYAFCPGATWDQNISTFFWSAHLWGNCILPKVSCMQGKDGSSILWEAFGCVLCRLYFWVAAKFFENRSKTAQHFHSHLRTLENVFSWLWYWEFWTEADYLQGQGVLEAWNLRWGEVLLLEDSGTNVLACDSAGCK